MNQLHATTDTQNKLQRQVELLQFEKDILLEELERQGVISEQLRYGGICMISMSNICHFSVIYMLCI